MGSFDRLRREIEAVPALSRAEERALAVASRQGDAEAKKRLIASALRHALPMASALSRHGSRWEPGDLLGEAVKALHGVADRYDGSRPFGAYAKPRMRGAMKDFLRRKADLLRTNGNEVPVYSLDAPIEEGSDWHQYVAGRTEEDPEEVPASRVPGLSRQELHVLQATILRQPRPGTVDEAAAALNLQPLTVARVLRRALHKRAATGPA